jgi:hypothetical protein
MEGGPEAPYQDMLSWEPVVAATNKDINEMVGHTDPELSAVEVEQLHELLANNQEDRDQQDAAHQGHVPTAHGPHWWSW